MVNNLFFNYSTLFCPLSISFIFNTHIEKRKKERERERGGGERDYRRWRRAVVAWMPIILISRMTICIHTLYSTYAEAISRWLSCSVISGLDHEERAIMRSRQHTTLRNEREFRECFSLSLSRFCLILPFSSFSFSFFLSLSVRICQLHFIMMQLWRWVAR